MNVNVRRRGLAAAILGLLLLLLPMRLESGSGIVINEACAEMICCPEIGSICLGLVGQAPHHYKTLDGTCPNN